MRATRTSARPRAQEIERQCLRGALALVVAGARTGAAHRAAIILGLRMHFGIAIDLAGRGQQQPRAGLLGQPQQVARAEHAGEHRMLGVGLVVRRRGGAGEMIDVRELGASAAQPLRQRCRSRHARRTRSAASRSRCARLSARPVWKLSTQITCAPSPISAVAQVRTDEARAPRHKRNLLVSDASHSRSLLLAATEPCAPAASSICSLQFRARGGGRVRRKDPLARGASPIAPRPRPDREMLDRPARSCRRE